MKGSKTVYLHSNKKLVIWGRSEYFEPSHLVERQFTIDEEVADSKDFRTIVQLYNDNAEYIKKLEEKVTNLESNYIKYLDRFVICEEIINKIKLLPLSKRIFKENIIKIIRKKCDFL